MNRRTYIKHTTFLGILGISSFSLFKCSLPHKSSISIEELEKYKPLIAELAESIIPRTDTPGAKDAKVEEFIIRMVKDCDNKKDQRLFLKGLADLREHTMIKYHCDFVDCSRSEKIATLNYFKSVGFNDNILISKIKHKFIGDSFYSHLHALTVVGFCTSELGATETLAYDYIPGTYEGCIPLQSNQKTWAT